MSNSTSDGSLANPFRWRIVLWLMGFAALGHFNRVGISVAGAEVFIPKQGLSETQMGWVYTAFLIVYTVGMIPGGWLIDRIGSARALTMFGVTMGSFVALTGMLGWLTRYPGSLYIGLLIVRCCAGLCNAPLHPGAAHVVAETMPAQNRATANGMVTAGALLGIAFCYPMFGSLIDHLGWPLAFILSGLLLVGFSALWSWNAGPSVVVVRDHLTPVQEIKGPAVKWTLSERVDLWLLSLSYAAYGYFQYLFFYWVEYYLESVLRLSKVDARWTSFWIMLAQGAGMAFGGMCTDYVCRRFGTAKGRRVVVMTGMGLGSLFTLLAMNVSHQINVAMCLAVSMGALGMCEGVFWTTATDMGGTSRGFSAAIMNTGGNIGGLISPILTPFMAKTIGWPGAIMVACLIVGIGGGIWFIIRLPDEQRSDASA